MRFFAVLFLCLCVLTPGALFGQGQTYIEGFLGSTSLDIPGANVDDETAFGLWGGYAFSENFAVEIGYTNYGESEFSDSFFDGFENVTEFTSDKISSFNIGIKGVVPLDGGIFITGKVGMAFWEFERQFSVIADSDGALLDIGKATLDDEDLYFGLGASYMISDTAYATLDYLTVEFGDLDVGVISFGIGTVF